jgi:hypothetical protein
LISFRTILATKVRKLTIGFAASPFGNAERLHVNNEGKGRREIQTTGE